MTAIQIVSDLLRMEGKIIEVFLYTYTMRMNIVENVVCKKPIVPYH